MKTNQQYYILTLIILVIATGVFLFLRNRKSQQIAKQQDLDKRHELASQAAKAAGLPVPPPVLVEPPPPPVASAPGTPKPTVQVMNTDPTYIMATRVYDSVSSWTMSPADKTIIWASLASKSDAFIKHTNNWFNGHFGGGKTMRQRIESQWTGEKSIILNRLSKIGL